MDSPTLDYRQLRQASDQLQPIRSELYDQAGPGYHVFRGFISPAAAEEMALFWLTLDPTLHHQPFLHRKCFHIRSPNFFQGPGSHGDIQFYNFFWNPPPDEQTQSVAHEVQLLRSRLENRQLLHDLYPAPAKTMLFGYSTSYRISINKQGDVIVPPHRDWDGRPANDPTRLQATLILSKLGRDYIGDGFKFETNQRKKIVLGRELEVEPGDLLLWRYHNLHEVSNVRPGPSGRGFIRATFPTVYIYGNRSRLRELYWQAISSGPGQWLSDRTRAFRRVLRGLPAKSPPKPRVYEQSRG